VWEILMLIDSEPVPASVLPMVGVVADLAHGLLGRTISVGKSNTHAIAAESGVSTGGA
jgi:hypothetical protein